ncbi:hypothetical protein ACA910_012665 [Epithemia clementina (nom. ined.)]
MSRQINQPINQVKLTNVAVVRCNKGGKRFEIACYRNKVLDYRAGLEKDMSEVLQTDRIFTNVSKGQFAKVTDLEKAFGTRDQEEIAKMILEQSDKQQSNLQVSDLERAQSIKDTLSQIATWVAANCVHSDNDDNRPFTPSQIRHALAKCYTAHPNKPIKKQCLDAVKFLKTVIPIERAKMEIQLQYPPDQEDFIESTLQTQSHKVIRRSSSETMNTMVVHVDPSMYRDLSEIISTADGSLEILEQVVMSKQGDIDLEHQLDMNNRQQQQQLPTAEKGHDDTNNNNNNKTTVELDSTELDEQDSDVDELVERLENIRGHHGGALDGGGGEHEMSDDDEDDIALSKKDQKKNRKKSKKAKRREQEEEEERLLQRQAQHEKRHPQQQQPHSQSSVVVDVDAPTTTTPAPFDATGVVHHSSGEDVDAVKSCNTCGGSFATTAAYRAHFKSDWHRFNQKLKMKGIPAVTEEEFLLCDADTFFNNNSNT